MNAQQKGTAILIRSALENKPYTLPEGFDFVQAAQESLRHKIIALTYYGAVNCGIDKKSMAMQKLFKYLIATLNISDRQQYEIKQICKTFDENGIEYLPMKGTVLQKYYPSVEMRTMGDADILIRMEQYEQIKPLMQKLGYEFFYESDHEFVWRKDKIDIELHKRVMTSYNKDFFKYFGDGWSFAKKAEDSETRYVISDEDFYIYMFVHFTKHYRISGIGIKHMIDFWVYKNAHPELDARYIDERLELLNLKEFHGYVMQTLGVWFNDDAPTEKTDYITEVIFTSGEYGLADTARAGQILREAQSTGSVKSAKKRSWRRMIFLPIDQMKDKYRAVRAIPILLPLFWIVRLVDVALFKRGKVKDYMKHMKIVDENAIKHQEALEFVGLQFHTEE